MKLIYLNQNTKRYNLLYAGMMELVVMLDSKSSGFTRVGSSPTTGTKLILSDFLTSRFYVIIQVDL